MQFNKNKTAFIHRWYPFVEGYSKEFIHSIIKEIDYKPESALDPFAGSGTTPIELQDIGIKCHSFEVSPFMHLLATVKLERDYDYNVLASYLLIIENFLNGKLQPIRLIQEVPMAQTFQPRQGKTKWVFHKCVMDGILDIKHAISLIDEKKYKQLFLIALASILLDVSNVYRNGKCLSYKKGWQDRKLHRRQVHQKFLDKLYNVILPDIKELEKSVIKVNNLNHCIYGDVRKKLVELPDKSIDLVITSPPYLNSRDYTDIYIVELWLLDLIKNYNELKELRYSTFISHVQVVHKEVELINIPELTTIINKLNSNKKRLWNSNLPTMVQGYFRDMNILFNQLKTKMISEKKMFFNVANSAYNGVEIKVDEIIANIAETNGFAVNEIREARQLKSSGQQKKSIKSLRESVIIMTAP